MKCQINLDIYNPEAPAFWPAAPLRRTSVLPQAKPWRRANSLRPSISITERWSDQRERNPKENATCIDKSHFLLVEVRGVEPLSESTLTGLSPGADGYCGSLSPCSPSGRQAVTPSGQVRVIMRGRGNSYPPHGRHINDAFPGLWPLRFRRPPLIRQQ